MPVSTAIDPVSTGTLAVSSATVEAARRFAAASRAENTKRTYACQWGRFVAWCAARRLASLPADPGTVIMYASELATSGRRVATVQQAMSAISAAHGTAGLPSPKEDARLRQVIRGIRRELGVAQREAKPIMAAHIKAMVAALPGGLRGVRNRALLLVGFSGGFRRSELVGLVVSDVVFTAEGLEVTVRRSKTDQEGRGMLKALPYSGNPELCPVRALRAWLDGAGITEGPVFRAVDRHGRVGAEALTGGAVAGVVKEVAEAAGLGTDRVSAHSLRAGFVSQAKASKRDEASIMRQTGHRSVAMVRKYDRRASLWTDNAAAGLLD
jgi:integrase